MPEMKIRHKIHNNDFFLWFRLDNWVRQRWWCEEIINVIALVQR